MSIQPLVTVPDTGASLVPALELRDLEVAYKVRGRTRPVLRKVSLRIEKGESYGLVGESGCGKSTAVLSVVRYLPREGQVTGGQILVDGQDVMAMGRKDLRRYRSDHVAMVYQEPGTALNPSMTVGAQVSEVFSIRGASNAEAVERAVDMLAKVRIADPGSVLGRYPHQLSGGMQQRIVIAMALAADPSLLVLDEPTTGLDATVEAEVLDLVAQLRAEFDSSVLFISHNLAVIRRTCDRVGVLYAGQLVEEAPVDELFSAPQHPYTVGLLRCLPRPGARKSTHRLQTVPGSLPAAGADLPGCVFVDRCPIARDVCRTTPPPFDRSGGHAARCHFPEEAAALPDTSEAVGAGTPVARGGMPILRLSGAGKTYAQGAERVHALHDVSLDLWPGETLGLVGESGSGKTTLAKVVMGLTEPDSGSILSFEGFPLAPTVRRRGREQVRALQIVFQNPDSALNRRHTVRRLIGRSLEKLAGLKGPAKEDRLRELLAAVKLDESHLAQRPVQLSGGMKQRVAIARAFAGDPRVVVCDEPTSALDVSVQAAILNLLVDLQERERVSYVFISHDLGVVRYLSDRIAVLYLGRLLELGPAEDVFTGPHHPYTEALLSAVPSVDDEGRERIRLEGEIPSATSPPSGCVFHTRCPRFLGDVCATTAPPEQDAGGGHVIRCHIPVDELRELQTVAPVAIRSL
ncbi:ABC transporter ATP-binding protein [soil metagenome]